MFLVQSLMFNVETRHGTTVRNVRKICRDVARNACTIVRGYDIWLRCFHVILMLFKVVYMFDGLRFILLHLHSV